MHLLLPGLFPARAFPRIIKTYKPGASDWARKNIFPLCGCVFPLGWLAAHRNDCTQTPLFIHSFYVPLCNISYFLPLVDAPVSMLPWIQTKTFVTTRVSLHENSVVLNRLVRARDNKTTNPMVAVSIKLCLFEAPGLLPSYCKFSLLDRLLQVSRSFPSPASPQLVMRNLPPSHHGN